jgi:hypothetical protein
MTSKADARAKQELLDRAEYYTKVSIKFVSPRIGHIQANEDGTHAKFCCCRWCVTKRWNESK